MSKIELYSDSVGAFESIEELGAFIAYGKEDWAVVSINIPEMALSTFRFMVDKKYTEVNEEGQYLVSDNDTIELFEDEWKDDITYLKENFPHWTIIESLTEKVYDKIIQYSCGDIIITMALYNDDYNYDYQMRNGNEIIEEYTECTIWEGELIEYDVAHILEWFSLT